MTEHRDSLWRRGRCHALWLHQGGLCFHCGRPMPDPLGQRQRHRKRDDAATIEHVLPRTLGGRQSWVNEVAACRACNAAKADRLPTAMEVWRLVWLKREDALTQAHDTAATLAALESAQDHPSASSTFRRTVGSASTGNTST